MTLLSQDDKEEKAYEERRKKDRRQVDIYRKQRIRHCAKRLAHASQLFNEEVDELLDAIGLTREEVDDR